MANVLDELVAEYCFELIKLPEGNSFIKIYNTLPKEIRVNKALFSQLWELHPEEYGHVKFMGKVIPTPRWQQSYGQPYHFSGLLHQAHPIEHPYHKKLQQWVNEFAASCVETENSTSDNNSNTSHANNNSGTNNNKNSDNNNDNNKDNTSKISTNHDNSDNNNNHHDSTTSNADNTPIDYNQMLINWYKDGNHYIGKHSDNEFQLVPNSDIFSFSFGKQQNGVQRKLVIRSKKDHNFKREIPMPDNSLIVMGGEMQKYYTHEVPISKRVLDPRINITFRRFVVAQPIHTPRINITFRPFDVVRSFDGQEESRKRKADVLE